MLFAMFTKLRLNTEASNRLFGSIENAPDEQEVGLVELRQNFKLSDMSILAEILQSVQPQRVIIGKPLTGCCLEALADYISIDLCHLRSLEMIAPLPKNLPQVARLLRRCPDLDRCYLRPVPDEKRELTRDDVQSLRAEFQTQI